MPRIVALLQCSAEVRVGSERRCRPQNAVLPEHCAAMPRAQHLRRPVNRGSFLACGKKLHAAQRRRTPGQAPRTISLAAQHCGSRIVAALAANSKKSAHSTKIPCFCWVWSAHHRFSCVATPGPLCSFSSPSPSEPIRKAQRLLLPISPTNLRSSRPERLPDCSAD